MTTIISDLDEDISLNIDSTTDNLQEIILDLSLDLEDRIKAIEDYYEVFSDETLEIINKLAGMYQFSGTKLLETFLHRICTHGRLSTLLKLEAAKSLIMFEEDEEGSDSEDDDDLALIKKESNEKVKKRNIKRMKSSYKALDCVCYDLSDLPTPCRVDAVCLLMNSEDHQVYANTYFKEIICDTKIDCDFRYKTILSLENKNVLTSSFFIMNACLVFSQMAKNMSFYRILSSQYLLQKCKLTSKDKDLTESILVSFAQDTELDYNLRADASDVLLSLGTDKTKVIGREIIMLLGRSDGQIKTVFDNAQNVHTHEIEASVLETLEFLAGLPLTKIGDNEITFDYVKGQIIKIVKENVKENVKDCTKSCKNKCKHLKCKLCDGCVKCKKKYKENEYTFCKDKCYQEFIRQDKIIIAINRIFMDRALYSKYNNTLVNILLKVWTYLTGHESEDVMKYRLIEELEEMSGTCSSGFYTRLINVMSGFGQFNIRISWEDQIIANISGRFNALAMKITQEDSVFYTTKSSDVVKLWLDRNKDVLKKEVLYDGKKVNMNKLIEKYKNTETLKVCVEDFAENVINEMAVISSAHSERQNYSLFFRTYVMSIRSEMFEEFKEHIPESDFDIWFRNGISKYEGS
jgi:hypothetical protein